MRPTFKSLNDNSDEYHNHDTTAHLARALVLVVGDDHGVVTRAAGERAAVTDLGLDGRDHGTLRHGAEGKDVAHSEGRCMMLASVVGRDGCDKTALACATTTTSTIDLDKSCSATTVSETTGKGARVSLVLHEVRCCTEVDYLLHLPYYTFLEKN